MAVTPEDIRQAMLRMKDKDHRFTITIEGLHYYVWRIFIRGAPVTISVELRDPDPAQALAEDPVAADTLRNSKGDLVITSLLRGLPPRETVEADIRLARANELGPS